MKKKNLNPLDYDSVSTCTECPMLGMDHVPSEGDPMADIMIIGQSPGDNEVKNRRPFCGPSGDILDIILDEAELPRSQVYIANALKCHPPGNRPATSEELVICTTIWLKKEIKTVDPRIVLILGKDAFMATMPRSKYGEWGHLVKIKSKSRLYLISYHPSFFIRRSDLEGPIEVGKVLRELMNDE